MQDNDQQLSLILSQSQKIQKTYSTTNPYTLNSFNQKFDSQLEILVIHYKFDFDKVALHLYYEHPQFQQKITSRSIAFRWWQIKVQKRKLDYQKGYFKTEKLKNYKLNQLENQTQTHNSTIEEQKPQSNKQPYQNYFENLLNSFNNSKNFNALPDKRQSPDYSKYQKALQLSQVLTEEQEQKFILYKPKFIVDTEYRLEQYEVDMEDQFEDIDLVRNRSQQIIIDKYLKKVAENDFQYDQFGKFQGFSVEGSFNNKKWWQREEQQQSQNQQQEQGQFFQK